MPHWNAVGPVGTVKPIALITPKGDRIGPPADPAVPEAILEQFSAETQNLAVAYFRGLQANGVRHEKPATANANKDWHYKGTPHYLAIQGKRLGLSQVLTDRAGTNEEIRKANTLGGQLHDRYIRTPRVGGVKNGPPIVHPPDVAQIRATINHMELEGAKLHALAAASHAMADDICRAYGMEPPVRTFRVVSDSDQPAVEPAKPEAVVPAVVPGVPSPPVSQHEASHHKHGKRTDGSPEASR